MTNDQLAIAALPGSTEPVFMPAPAVAEPGPGQVLCRTLQLGVCGTDREILGSGAPWTPPHESSLILGHECLARVEAIGAGVAEFAVGELVVPVVRRALPPENLPPAETERAAPFAASRVDLLPFGTYVERGIVREHGFSSPRWLDRPEHLCRVDQALADLAVLAEPLAVAEKAINEAIVVQQARLGAVTRRGDLPRVLVTGMGPIAFAGVIGCVARHWPVTMFGRDAGDSFRAELARRLGASYLSDQQADFDPADVERDGYDLILECTGSDAVMIRAARGLATCGAMVWLGAARVSKPRSHDVDTLLRQGLVRNHLHLGSVNAAMRDFDDALSHLDQLRQSDPQTLTSLITARVAPAESLWHYTHRQPQGIKTVLMYE